jgi:DNA-binding MarR family transcriptional regulator
MRDGGYGGEEYAFLSYLYASGPRSMTAIAREFDVAVTTVAGILGPAIERGEVERRSIRRDARMRPLALTEAGITRHAAAMERYHVRYDALERSLVEGGLDVEALAAELDELTEAIRLALDLDEGVS